MTYLIKLCATLVLIANTAISQDAVISPKQGTLERKVILDGLRPKLEAELKSELVFVVSDIRVNSDWHL